MHDKLLEDVYVDQPLGYEKGGREKVYKLRKDLYDLRQAPRSRYNKVESYFCHEKCPREHTLFVKHNGDTILIVSMYVDDLIYTDNNDDLFECFKESMKIKFTMTCMGNMRCFLGVEVK